MANATATVSGKLCKKWSEEGTYNEDHNYCRNPNVDRKSQVWCFTTDPKTEWENCAVPICTSGNEDVGQLKELYDSLSESIELRNQTLLLFQQQQEQSQAAADAAEKERNNAEAEQSIVNEALEKITAVKSLLQVMLDRLNNRKRENLENMKSTTIKNNVPSSCEQLLILIEKMNNEISSGTISGFEEGAASAALVLEAGTIDCDDKKYELNEGRKQTIGNTSVTEKALEEANEKLESAVQAEKQANFELSQISKQIEASEYVLSEELEKLENLKTKIELIPVTPSTSLTLSTGISLK